MTVLIVSALGTFFANDHEKCQEFNFEIEDKCIDGNSVKVTIKNNGASRINFKSNQENKLYSIFPNNQDILDFSAQRGDIDIIPYFEDTQKEQYDCKGKTETIVVERLMKCSK